MPFLICNTTEYVAVTNGKIRSVSDISLAKIFEGEGEARAFFATLAPYFKNHDFAVTKTRVKPNITEVENEEAVNIGIEKRKSECFLLLDKAQSVVTDFDAIARIANLTKTLQLSNFLSVIEVLRTFFIASNLENLMPVRVTNLQV